MSAENRGVGRNTMYVVDDLISSLLSGEAPDDQARPVTPPLPRASAIQPSIRPSVADQSESKSSSRQYGTLPSVPFKDDDSTPTATLAPVPAFVPTPSAPAAAPQYDALPVNPHSLATTNSQSSSAANPASPAARRVPAVPPVRRGSMPPTGAIPVPSGAPPRANLRPPIASLAMGSPPARGVAPMGGSLFANASTASAGAADSIAPSPLMSTPPPSLLAPPPALIPSPAAAAIQVAAPRRNSPIPPPPPRVNNNNNNNSANSAATAPASAGAMTMGFGTMTLPRGQWTGDEVILTVNVPHIEATSKFKFRMDMLVNEAIDHIRDSLQKKGLLFGADLESTYTLFTLGGRGGGGTMRRTGSLFAMKSHEALSEYFFIPGDMLYFKPLFTPSATTVAPPSLDGDAAGAGAATPTSSSQPTAPPVMRNSFTQRAALPAPLAEASSLHQLAQAGDNARIQEVLAVSKIAVDHQDVHGNTALMWASARGHIDVVQQLLRSGASVDLQNKSGATALLYSARKGKIDCVRALINAQANPNLRDATGNSPVSTASKNGHADIVRDLLAHGADVNARDTTALLWASKKGHLEIVRMLLAHGADKLVATAEGKTALDLARPHPAIVDVLRAWGPELARLAPAEIELGSENTLVTVDIRNFGAGTTISIDGVDMVTTELRRGPGDIVQLQFQAPPSDFPCFRHIELAHADGARCVAQRALRYGQPSQEATASLRIGKFDQDAGYVPPPLPPGAGAASAPASPRVSAPDAPPPTFVAPPPMAMPARPPIARRNLSSSMRGPAPARAPPLAVPDAPPDAPMRKVGSTPSLATPGRALPPMPRGGMSVPPPEPPAEESAAGPPPQRPQMPPPMPSVGDIASRRPELQRTSPMSIMRQSLVVPSTQTSDAANSVGSLDRRSSLQSATGVRSSVVDPLISPPSSPRTGRSQFSKPTDVQRNRDAVKAMLTQAGVDASIVDRKPGSFQAAATVGAAGGGGAAGGDSSVMSLERSAVYAGGFSDTHSTILWLWDTLHSMSSMELSTFCQLVSGNAQKMPSAIRIAKGGTGTAISVTDAGGAQPTLVLPVFSSKKDLADSLKNELKRAFLAAMTN